MAPNPIKKRILIFSLAYFPIVGGAEIAVKEITDRISVDEFEWHMITMRLNKTHLREEKIGNCLVYRIGGGLGYLGKIFLIPQAALYALKLSRKHHYDAYWGIMTYMIFPIVIARIFSNQTPYILTLQDGDSFEKVFGRLRIFPFLPILFYGFRRASKVQTISKFLTRWARDMGYSGTIEVIPNGVNLDKFVKIGAREPMEEREVILITTSRLVTKNAIDVIIKALVYLPEKFRLKVLGGGPLKKSLNRLAESKNLTSRVEFAGNVSVDEIPRYLNKADIFVRPSRSEGFGSSFVEAMAMGLPVIGTPVGGIVDFLFDPETNPNTHATGLFAETDNPKSVANQVMRLVEDSKLRETLIENSRKLVREKYDWNLIARDMKSRVFNNI
jgi:glycosyltransferase involved in cell wall biosynthesis